MGVPPIVGVGEGVRSTGAWYPGAGTVCVKEGGGGSGGGGQVDVLWADPSRLSMLAKGRYPPLSDLTEMRCLLLRSLMRYTLYVMATVSATAVRMNMTTKNLPVATAA